MSASGKSNQRRKNKKQGNDALPSAPPTREYSQPKVNIYTYTRQDRRQEMLAARIEEEKQIAERKRYASNKYTRDMKQRPERATLQLAQCWGCNCKYEILLGSPLLNQSTQIQRDQDQDWWLLNPETECIECSRKNRFSLDCYDMDASTYHRLKAEDDKGEQIQAYLKRV